MTEEAKFCVESCRDWYQAFANYGKGEERTVKELLTTANLIESLSEQLEQTENKLSELLYYVTGGRYSKTDYSTDDMRRFVDDYNQSTCNECDKCDELEQVTRERDALLDELKGECDVCTNRKDCTAPKCRKSPRKECEECPCRTCIIDTNWKREGVEVE